MTNSPARILITGASGCVGQYTASWLLEKSNAELLLWLRDPSKLTAIAADHPRVHLLVGDLRESDRFASELATVNRVIHTATWGDPERAQQVNVVAVKRISAGSTPTSCSRWCIFHRKHSRSASPTCQKPWPTAEYIQTKAQCLQELERHPLAERIMAVFPTLVFDGRVGGTSFPQLPHRRTGRSEQWLWLARFLRADANFHFIHAADIAAICVPWLPHTNRTPGRGAIRRIVMGQRQ